MPDELTYAGAGVDIDVTDAAKRQMADVVDRGDPRVLNRLGAFASLLQGSFPGYRRPVLVMKTEEPGSKQRLAFAHGRHASIGVDLIHHLINDIIVMGAQPLYVQDCIICSRMDPGIVKTLVASMSDACQKQGCVLCGGETSVQPGVLAGDGYVLTASAIGVVDEPAILDGSKIREGDVVLAAASNGLHTNGYSLVRKLLERDPGLAAKRLGAETFMEVILRPHTCYYLAVRDLFGDPDLKGLAHITGGGVQGNLDRILPQGLDAQIDLSRLQVPEVFSAIRQAGPIPDSEMLRTFNMGVGLAVVCSASAADRMVAHLRKGGCHSYAIGQVVPGTKQVRFTGAIDWED